LSNDPHDDSIEEVDGDHLIEDILLILSSKKKWKSRMCNLSGGVIVVEGKKKYDHDILLRDSEVTIEEGGYLKKDFVFKVKTQDGKEYYFASKEQQTIVNWVQEINNLKDMEVTVELREEEDKLDAGKRMRRYIGSKVASSTAGKKIIKELIGKNGIKILDIIKKVIAAQTGDDKKGKEVEEDIIKIGVKAILLHRDKDISSTDVNALKPALRAIWNVVLDYAGVLNFDCDCEKIRNKALDLHNGIKRILQPHVSEVNYQKIDNIYEIIFSPERMNLFFTSPDFVEDRQILVSILEKHYKF